MDVIHGPAILLLRPDDRVLDLAERFDARHEARERIAPLVRGQRDSRDLDPARRIVMNERPRAGDAYAETREAFGRGDFGVERSAVREDARDLTRETGMRVFTRRMGERSVQRD